MKKGFTLVELLAVIVILAVILIIAIPQIMSTIDSSKIKTLENSARLIAKNADQYYISQKTINDDYNGSGITCSNVAKLDNNYGSCSITYDSNGKATVVLKGAQDNKFDGKTCIGTKDVMNCGESISIDSTRIYAYLGTDLTKWTYATDSYSIKVPVTVGEKYLLRFTTTSSSLVSTIFRYAFANTNSTPTSGNPVSVTNVVRTSPQATQSVIVTATGDYMVIQLASSTASSILSNNRLVIIKL